jgi:type II secretory pathway pseudopilin PulG
VRADRLFLRRRIRSRAVAAERNCAGVTLVELLCAMVLAVFVLAGAVTLLVLTFRQENYITSRNVAKNTAEAGLEQLELDLREAVSEPSISTAGGTTTLSFSDPVPGSGGAGSESVTWTCTASVTTPGTCTRVVGAGPTAQTRLEIDGLEAFTVTPYGTSGSALSLPTSASSPVSAVALQLAVQESAYGLTSARGSATTALPGSRTLDLSSLTDLRNET